jgi:pimeloyl-ACP methyl ester carboxylesterase
MTSNEWKSKGKFIQVNNNRLFVIDTNNGINTSQKSMVILHGYPTSSFDYYKVLPELSKNYRVILHDHLGFGFSDKPKDVDYSLVTQADIALELWRQLGLKKIFLFAHDYGTSVATEIIARYNANELDIEIEQLILTNGSIHIELSQLRTIQKLLKHKFLGKYVAKLTNFLIFKKNMKNIYFDTSKVTDNELKEMWKLIELNGGRKVIHKLTQYINERYLHWNRWIGALKETQISTKIIWAKNDPIAVPAIAKLLAKEIPNNTLYWIENTGHFLMLENPKELLELILKNNYTNKLN